MSSLLAEDRESLESTEWRAPHRRIAAFWLGLAVLATIALFLRHRSATLDGDFQGWASASCMLMARAFAQLGTRGTHFVPFQNNLPVGADPDVYLHWPPLYPLVLSGFLRVFGDKASSGRLLEFLITLASAGVVFLIARRLYAPRVAMLASFFFLTSRATYEGASAILQQPLAVLFALVSVYCFLQASESGEAKPRAVSPLFAVLGVLATILAILSAWDPIFVPFGLLVTAWLLRQRTALRLAALYCIAAVLTFAAVELDYILAYPKLFTNQLATIAYRAGVPFPGGSAVRLATIVDVVHYAEAQYGFFAAYWRALRFVDQYFTSLMLSACLIFLALWWRNGRRSDRSATWVLGGLLLPTVVWFALMRNYVAIHPFPLVLAAPFVAIASGFVLDRLWTRFSAASGDQPILWVLMIGLPLLVIHPLLVQYRDAQVAPTPEFADLSQLIEDNTPATAIVLTPTESLVPTYYSHRHLVRGIESDHWVTQATELAHRDFPGSPLFLAVRDIDANNLPRSLAALPQGLRRGDSVLYRLP